MSPSALYLLPGLAIAMVFGAALDRLTLGADRDAWIDRTSRCAETLEHANDAKKRCISALESVCGKLAEVEGADVIQARLMHAEPYKRVRRGALAGKSPIVGGSTPEIMTITSIEQGHDHDGT